jgi:hypothetical protein
MELAQHPLVVELAVLGKQKAVMAAMAAGARPPITLPGAAVAVERVDLTRLAAQAAV